MCLHAVGSSRSAPAETQQWVALGPTVFFREPQRVIRHLAAHARTVSCGDLLGCHLTTKESLIIFELAKGPVVHIFEDVPHVCIVGPAREWRASGAGGLGRRRPKLCAQPLGCTVNGISTFACGKSSSLTAANIRDDIRQLECASDFMLRLISH